MTTVRAKQLQNPGGVVQGSNSSAGSTIVFDGTYPVWSGSSLAVSGLIVPNGTTEHRPSTPATGLIRWNTSLTVPEFYTGTTWLPVIIGDINILRLSDTPDSYSGLATTFLRVNSGATGIAFTTASFLDLSDAPQIPYTGMKNKVVRVKEDETGLEFFTFASAITRYRIIVQLGSINPDHIVSSPPGWTVNIVTVDDLYITHNLNKFPSFVVFWGQTADVSGTVYTQRTSSNAGAHMSYDTANSNVCTVENVNNTNAGAKSGGLVWVDVYFQFDY